MAHQGLPVRAFTAPDKDGDDDAKSAADAQQPNAAPTRTHSYRHRSHSRDEPVSDGDTGFSIVAVGGLLGTVPLVSVWVK